MILQFYVYEWIIVYNEWIWKMINNRVMKPIYTRKQNLKILTINIKNIQVMNLLSYEKL